MTAFREYLLILLLALVAMIAIYYHFGKLLTGAIQQSVTRVNIER